MGKLKDALFDQWEREDLDGTTVIADQTKLETLRAGAPRFANQLMRPQQIGTQNENLRNGPKLLPQTS